MVEDRRKDYRADIQDSDDDMIVADRSRGSGLIFVLIAIALLLAVGFFYLTKENDGQSVGSENEEANSAAYVVGEGARQAADTLRNRN